MGEVKDLLVILISSSLVSNVVLSQFLGLCPFLGVSKKINTAAGMGGAIICHYPFQRHCRCDLSVCVDAVSYGIPADHRVYFSDCRTGTVCGNVLEEVHKTSVSGAWRVSASDNDELCRTWRGTYECAEGIRHSCRYGKWFCNGFGLYDCHCDSCRHQGKNGL